MMTPNKKNLYIIDFGMKKRRESKNMIIKVKFSPYLHIKQKRRRQPTNNNQKKKQRLETNVDGRKRAREQQNIDKLYRSDSFRRPHHYDVIIII